MNRKMMALCAILAVFVLNGCAVSVTSGMKDGNFVVEATEFRNPFDDRVTKFEYGCQEIGPCEIVEEEVQ